MGYARSFGMDIWVSSKTMSAVAWGVFNGYIFRNSLRLGMWVQVDWWQWRKSSQWFMLVWRHAEAVLQDSHVFRE